MTDASDGETSVPSPHWHTSSCRDPKDRRLPDRVSSGRPLSISRQRCRRYQLCTEGEHLSYEIIQDLQTAGVVRTR